VKTHRRLGPDVAEQRLVVGPLGEAREVETPRRAEAAVVAIPPVPQEERLADVEHEEVRRPLAGELPHVAAELAEGLAEDDVVGPARLLVLAFEGEVVGLVEVDEVDGLRAVAVHHLDGELELVAAAGGARGLDAEGPAELDEVALQVGLLGGLGARPTLGEGLELRGGNESRENAAWVGRRQ